MRTILCHEFKWGRLQLLSNWREKSHCQEFDGEGQKIYHRNSLHRKRRKILNIHVLNGDFEASSVCAKIYRFIWQVCHQERKDGLKSYERCTHFEWNSFDKGKGINRAQHIVHIDNVESNLRTSPAWTVMLTDYRRKNFSAGITIELKQLKIQREKKKWSKFWRRRMKNECTI